MFFSWRSGSFLKPFVGRLPVLTKPDASIKRIPGCRSSILRNFLSLAFPVAKKPDLSDLLSLIFMVLFLFVILPKSAPRVSWIFCFGRQSALPLIYCTRESRYSYLLRNESPAQSALALTFSHLLSWTLLDLSKCALAAHFCYTTISQMIFISYG